MDNPFEFAIREQLAETLRMLGAPEEIATLTGGGGDASGFERLAEFNTKLRRELRARLGERDILLEPGSGT